MHGAEGSGRREGCPRWQHDETLQLAHPLELRQTTQAYLVTHHITVLAWIKLVESLKCFYDSIVRDGGLLKLASGIKL